MNNIESIYRITRSQEVIRRDGEKNLNLTVEIKDWLYRKPILSQNKTKKNWVKRQLRILNREELCHFLKGYPYLHD